MGTDIRVRIRRTIIRIKVERSGIITIIPVATEIEYTRSIEIAIITKIFSNLKGFIA